MLADLLILQDHETVSGKGPSHAQAERHPPAASNEQLSVTHKQMQDSGYADAFAKIMEGIPDHVKQHPSAKRADLDSAPQSDRSHSQPESVLTDEAHSSEVGAAVAAAMDKVAEQQQQQQAASLDGGAAYPEHVAQVPR